jgi:hypothetical protein
MYLTILCRAIVARSRETPLSSPENRGTIQQNSSSIAIMPIISTMSPLASNGPSQSKRTVKQKENPDGTLTARPIKKTKGEIAAAAAATANTTANNTTNTTVNTITKSKSKSTNKESKKRKMKPTEKTSTKVPSPPSPPEATLSTSSATYSIPSATPPIQSAPKPPKTKTHTSSVTIHTEDEEEEAMVAAGTDEVIEVDVNGKERHQRPVRHAPTPSSHSGSSDSEEDDSSGSESELPGSENKETDEAQLG